MAGAGKIHPGRLLLTLKVLLAPSGGIKSAAEVDRLVPLMEKFSRKLVSRIIYLNVLLSSSNDLLELFLSRKGWSLLGLWFIGATKSNNVPLRIKLLQVCLRCPPPPPDRELDEMLKNIQVLTKRIKQIEMSVLALQVLNKWKIPTSLENTSDTGVSCRASTKPAVETKTTRKELTIKTESFSSFTIPKRIKKFRSGPLRVTYQDGDSHGIKDHEGLKKSATSSDGTDVNVNVVLQTWSRINGLKRKEVFSSLSSYAAADGMKSRLAAFPARSQGSKPALKTLSQEDKAKNIKKFRVDSEVSSRNENKDVNENVPKSTKDQATSDSFFCEDKFYDEDLQKEKDAKTEENSSRLIQKSSKATDREDSSEKRKKEVDDFKKKRREERDQKLKRQEEQQKARISFNKTEYKRDLDNDSKKKIKELADSLKHKEGKPESIHSSKKEERTRTDVKSSPLKSEKNSSKKEDRSRSSSPKRSVRNKHRDSPEDRHRSKSRRRSRSRDRTSRGGRETISGIRQLRRSRSRSRSRSPRKRRREEKEPRNSSTSSNSKSKAESKSSRVSDHKESLKEVNLFNDEYLKSCRDKKPKRLSRVQNKTRASSNPKSSSDPGPASKTSVPEESNDKNDDKKQRKKVTWTKDEDLVSVRFFEVIEEERGNVFKKKFEERRKLEAKNEKLKLSAVSLAKSIDESVCNKHESIKDIFKIPVSGLSWPALIPLAGLRTDIRVGSESEEKLIQRAREAEVLPLPILASAEPTEAETIHQRRSMVVSVKSILPVDISGEGTITDYSPGGWTNKSQFTRGLKYRTSSIPGYLQSGGSVKGGKVPIPCIYWGRGYCRNGDACRFLHEPKVVAEQECRDKL